MKKLNTHTELYLNRYKPFTFFLPLGYVWQFDEWCANLIEQIKTEKGQKLSFDDWAEIANKCRRKLEAYADLCQKLRAVVIDYEQEKNGG